MALEQAAVASAETAAYWERAGRRHAVLQLPRGGAGSRERVGRRLGVRTVPLSAELAAGLKESGGGVRACR